MTRAVERTWVAWLDSGTWRRFGRSPAGRHLMRSSAFRFADTTRRFAETSIRHAKDPDAFAEVRTFVLFLGSVKSGGSLVGALLDAHARAVLSDEADPLRYLTAGFGRERTFHVLAKTARREALKGRVTARRLEPYALAVPGQSQGYAVQPIVIGDSRAGPTTRRLGARPELIGRLRDVLGDVEDRYIHVVRNPYDPISAMVRRGRRTLPDAIADYAGQSHRVATLRNRLGDERLLTVRYEDFVAAPGDQLRRVCDFVGLEAEPGYLAACAAIIDPSRSPERHSVPWTPDAVTAVDRLVRQFGFLDGYAYTG
jgi:Sulfotransferase family